jgi:hypothetical protein
MMFFPFEIETTVTAEQGRIWIEQRQEGLEPQIIELTVHQFKEIFNREKMIIKQAQGDTDEL